ncbi:MAG: hypothetical protein J7L17_02415 [Thaumarchaeota archaeon]|nr:hypothetical protein [Nitrososphaerota archaeon]
MENAEIEHLIKLVGAEPYEGPDYGKRQRVLTLRLREILSEFGCEELYDGLRGSSGQLLKYSSKAFGKALNGIVAAVKSHQDLNRSEEYHLRRKILLAVAEAKYAPEALKDLRRT